MRAFFPTMRPATLASRLPHVVAAAALGLLLAACSDRAGSITGVGAAPTTLHAVRGDRPDSASIDPLALRAAAPALAGPRAGFWAVQGKRTGVAIEYARAIDRDCAQPFLQLTVPKNVQLVAPDGTPLARGDSIFIEVSVVPGRLAARFSPRGLVFGGPGRVKLALHYGYGDLQGEPASGLGIWYRSADGQLWERQHSKVDRKTEMVVADISHFSNYAVAF